MLVKCLPDKKLRV